jgi:hypothetical protein
VVNQELLADLDGDGTQEAIVCYREPDESVNRPGGVLILTPGLAGEWKVAWHALFENVYPKSVSASGGALTLDLLQTTMGEDKTLPRVFTRGKDFFFRGEDGSPFFGAKLKASSSLKREGLKPEYAFDGDVKTAWAEGAEGTGADESLAIEFKKPVDLGLIGVLHGNFKGAKEWKDNNRLHRADVTVETSSDRYDPDSNVDFNSDLGLGLYGDKVEMDFTNKPIMRYVKLDKRKVLSVQIKITSVLLGEVNDDTYISEIDLAELIPASKIFGEQKGAEAPGKGSKAPEEKKPEPKPQAKKPSSDWTDEED